MQEKTRIDLPLVPLRGMMMFPHTVLHFDVGRPKSVEAIEYALENDRKIFLVAQTDSEVEDPSTEELHGTGTIAAIRQVLHLSGNNMRVLVEGVSRAKLIDTYTKEEAYFASIEEIPLFDMANMDDKMRVLIRNVKEYFEEYTASGTRVSPDLLRAVKRIDDPDHLIDTISSSVISEFSKKLEMLSIENTEERLTEMCAFLAQETELASIERMVQMRVKMQLDKNQKEYYLREQMRVIKEELGEDEKNLIDEFSAQLEKLELNEEVHEKVSSEIERLSRLMPGSPEASVSENYIRWILDMPWGKYTRDKTDIVRARKVLDKNHYGMEEVKERIIEFLAVHLMRSKSRPDKVKGSILCFVGPPGVGKTSIVKAIAQAMGRKFVQMSLGGVRDAAEIYGHRRTYVGAIPGRIISGIKQAGTMNPVFLLDEVDKLSSDFRGDPSSALLEVLDGEQNNHFTDHYLEMPFDLSSVMFVTTANVTSTIPPALYDRMEIIEVSSYTEEEKYQIAKRHLIKENIRQYGLSAGSVRLTDAAIRKVIEGYTREAGVRTLSRTLAKIIRKAAVEKLESEQKTISVGLDKVTKYLGAEKYFRSDINTKPTVGVVNGLAYTSVGGEMLAVECIVMPGTGKFQLTGQLGDVMKESAQASLSWVRSKGKDYNITDDFFQKNDIHIHVPEGAVPKDGPSAGITMTVALMSAITGIAVRQDVAMTGELTLAGRVLPIGGVREKLLAAYRAGVKLLCLPDENKKDVEELPEYIRESFTIHYVSKPEEVLKIALLVEEDGNK
ncbi:MAG: endopeptidase La [Christensenellaceae bacterium]|nr:endopeptidase La [Christensenellaceae bacterium]